MADGDGDVGDDGWVLLVGVESVDVAALSGDVGDAVDGENSDGSVGCDGIVTTMFGRPVMDSFQNAENTTGCCPSRECRRRAYNASTC